MTASELRDWIACPTLWRLRRDQPPAQTIRASEHVRQMVVCAMAGADLPQSDVRWSPEVPYQHTAIAVAADVRRRVEEALEHRSWQRSGYHDDALSAIEALHMDHEREEAMLCWWLLDVGRQAASEAWLAAAAIAEQRPEATHVGVVDVRLRRWPTEPVVTLRDPRPVGPIAHELRAAQEASEWTPRSSCRRTPGLHCRRCPDLACSVRRDI